MDTFTAFAGIFTSCAMVLVAIILINDFFTRKKRESLKPVQYISYHKKHFHKDFEFTCTYCGASVSTVQPNCPQCGSTYGENQEYRRKRQAIHANYLNYLKNQEDKLRQETAYIEKTLKALRSNVFMRPTCYNFDLGEPPVYRPAADYEFTCDFCDSKLRGKSSDRHGCPNCGANYNTNSELLIREAEDRLEKRHFEEYRKLKDLEWQQNIQNEEKDWHISRKYAKQIAFLMKNGKYVALLIVALILGLSLVIACTLI